MAEFPDWASILPTSGALLPLVDDPDFHWLRPTTVRGYFVRLSEVAEALPTREFAGDAVAVYADVLRLDGALSMALPGLTLHARRIEVCAGTALALSAAQDAAPAFGLKMFADEWAFEDPAQGMSVAVGDIGHRIEAGIAGGFAMQIDAQGDAEVREFAEVLAGDALTGQLQLNAAKRLARGPQVKETAALPLRIANWVARTGGTPLLASDAQAYAARLRTPRGNVNFVPYLQLQEYARLAQTTLEALQAVEDESRTLFGRGVDIDAQKSAAQAMLGHYRNAKTYSDRLLKQAAEEVERASAATAQAQAKIDERKATLETKKKALDEGIEEKRREHEREAILNIVIGVALIGAGIATVWFSGPAGAGAAAAGAAQVGKAAADAGAEVSKLVQLIQKIAKVLDAIKKIKGYCELLGSAYAAIADPIEAARRAEAAGKSLPDPLQNSDLMGAADWQEFVIELDAAFAPVLQEKVAGAQEYLAEMKKLAIRGEDWVRSQANLERVQQQLQQRLWQSLRDESDLRDMQTHIGALDDQHRPGSILLGYYTQLRDLLKGRLIHAIDNLSDAYRYYALTEPAFTPSLAASGADLAKMLADVQQALIDAKERRGVISDWGPESLTEDGTQQLSALRGTRSLSWAVGAESFEGLDRVRVRDIRVWLRGTFTERKFYIVIRTPGDYADRYRQQAYEFATWPLQRVFRYERDPNGDARDPWGQTVRITLRANDAEGDYFEPTAFTTWTIELPQRYNDSLELSKIDGLALEFIGTAMPAAPLLAGLRGAPATKRELFRKVVVL